MKTNTAQFILKTCRWQRLKLCGLGIFFTSVGLLQLTNVSIASGYFRGALLAKEGITLNGTLRIDSFDSSDPLYSTNGQYIATRAKDGGNIGALASNTVNLISIGGAVDVFGHIYTGPGDTVALHASAQVGSTAWIMGSNLGIEPNHRHSDMILSISDLPPPPTNGLLPLPSKTASLFQGVVYSNSYLLTAGKYSTNSALTLGSSDVMLISGNVILYAEGNLKLITLGKIIIGTNSSLTIFAATNLELGGGGIINHTGFVTNLTIFAINPTNATVKYSGDSYLIGSICAPTADVFLSSGYMSGSVVGRTITIASTSFEIHYDEATPSPLPAWNNSPPQCRMDQIRLTVDGKPSFRVTGTDWYRYAVETSTNLVNWSRLTSNYAPFYFTNSTPVEAQQFFRLVSVP